MPELPEVETVVRDLRPLLLDARIESVEVGKHPLRRPWRDEWASSLRRRRVAEVRRRGKWIIIDLAGDLHLLVHLGMTGQLRIVPPDEEIAAHTHLVFGLEKGRGQLRFRDVRRFGCALLFSGSEQLELFFRHSGLGPEPFELESNYWRERLRATSRCLKAVLLDQRVVAGVGNIYADESLFEARLHPGQLGKHTEPQEATRLRRAIVKVLNRAIERHGSSIRDYVGGSGRQGEYQNELRAYGRTDEACGHCGTAIVCIRLAGRSTHYCPSCQRKRG